MFTKILTFSMVCVGLLAAPIATFGNEDDATGNLSFSGKSVALGIGASWGQGVLTFQGKRYPFKVSGFDLGSVGITSISGKGTVHDLYELASFSGTYSAVSAALALGGGVGVIEMWNQHGVRISLKSKQRGVLATFGGKGLDIELSQ